MHIAEGILTSSQPGIAVAAAGFVLSGIGIGIGLRQMDYEEVPRAGILGAAFFIVSLVPIPVGAGSVHLLLTGLMGILLGWGAFPTVAVALALQAIFFGDGGLSALGVNTLSMGLPAVVCGAVFGKRIFRQGNKATAEPSLSEPPLLFDRTLALRCGFLAGVLAVLLGTGITAVALAIADPSLSGINLMFIMMNLALAPIEGFVTAAALAFVCRVQPSLVLAK